MRSLYWAKTKLGYRAKVPDVQCTPLYPLKNPFSLSPHDAHPSIHPPNKLSIHVYLYPFYPSTHHSFPPSKPSTQNQPTNHPPTKPKIHPIKQGHPSPKVNYANCIFPHLKKSNLSLFSAIFRKIFTIFVFFLIYILDAPALKHSSIQPST